MRHPSVDPAHTARDPDATATSPQRAPPLHPTSLTLGVNGAQLLQFSCHVTTTFCPVLADSWLVCPTACSSSNVPATSPAGLRLRRHHDLLSSPPAGAQPLCPPLISRHFWRGTSLNRSNLKPHKYTGASPHLSKFFLPLAHAQSDCPADEHLGYETH